MYLTTVLVCHVLAAIGIGPTFTLPFLAKTPAALHAVLVFLRFGAGVTLVSGVLLWVALNPEHPIWLYLSSALFLGVLVVVGFVVSPGGDATASKPESQSRVRWGGFTASVLTIGIAILMVLRPSWG
jgi:hypothetical protein